MKRAIVAFFVGLLFVSSLVAQEKELSGAKETECQQFLETTFLNKHLVAKVTFPAYKTGIDLKTDGTWDRRWATRMIKDHGVGIEVGETVTVTTIKLKAKNIEIHLNGGGFGTFGDVLMSSDAKRNARDVGSGKLSGGSRINLKFDRPITEPDVQNVDQLVKYLEPVADAPELRREAMRQSIPEEFRQAAARGEIAVGMDKATVFAIAGEPKSKNVDISGPSPIEKWQYELSNMKVRIITFMEGKVAKVNEF